MLLEHGGDFAIVESEILGDAARPVLLVIEGGDFVYTDRLTDGRTFSTRRCAPGLGA